MAGDAPESKPSREETAANILRLGKCLNDLTFPERGIAGRTNRPYEVERLKTEIQALEKRIEQAVYDPNQRLLRSALEVRGDGVMDVLALRIVSYVAWAATHLERPGVSVARVAIAVSMGGMEMGTHLEARRTIRRMIVGENGLRYTDSEFGPEGELHLGLNLAKYISGEGNLMVVWSGETMEEEKAEWRRRQQFEDARRRASISRRLPPSRATQETNPPPISDILASPKAIHEALKLNVLGMDDTDILRRFSVAMSIHLRRVAQFRAGKEVTVPGQTILLAGESGVGKTFIVEQFCRIANLPHTIGSLAEVTSSGYVGMDISDILAGLFRNGARRADDVLGGLVFLDEADKRRTNDRRGDFDCTGSGVQAELLRVLEGADIQIGGRRSNDRASMMLSSRSLAFCLAGCFQEVTELMASRKRPLGFAGDAGDAGHAPDIREALTSYFLPELCNRISTILYVRPPSLDALTAIAIGNRGILWRQNEFLASLGLTLKPDEEAIRAVCGYSHSSKTYARGVRSLFQVLAEEAIFEERKGEIAIGAGEVRKAIEGLRQEPEGLKTRT